MKINTISGYKPSYYNNINNFKTTTKSTQNNTKKTDKLNYNPSFSGLLFQNNTAENFATLQENFTPEANSIYMASKAYALRNGSKTVETWHTYAVSLMAVRKFLKEIKEGKIEYDQSNPQGIPYSVEYTVTNRESIFNDSEKLDQYIKITEDHLKELPKKFGAKQPTIRNPFVMPQPSTNAVNDYIEAYEYITKSTQEQMTKFLPDAFFIASSLTSDTKLLQEERSYIYDLRKVAMIDDSNKKQKNHLSIYDDKADAVWKNINMNKDVICVYDAQNADSVGHMTSSIINLVNKPGQNYKNIDPKNTNIVLMNKNADFRFLTNYIEKIKKAPKNPEERTVIIASLRDLIINNQGNLMEEDLNLLSGRQTQGLKNKINIVYTIDNSSYFSNTASGAILSNILPKYSTQTIPSLNAGDAVKYLTDGAGLNFIKSKTQREFDPETIRKTVELTAQSEGNYPDKVVSLLKDVSDYYYDKETLNIKDIETYIENNKTLSDSTNSSKDTSVIFDTGKTLDDIVGSPMTKAEAASIVKQIKNGIGTKGFIISNAGGSSYGGGRKNVAEAIAGEAKIPMLKINAQEFATKDIDTLSQKADLSEVKIKKIVAAAKAQAEANPDKTAMLFIENFDNFASDPLYGVSSIYEQKAFSQLLAEMEKIRANDDINLIIMGSVNRPQLINENILKPDKFLNQIVVYQPHQTEERKEILKYYIDKKELNIKNETPEALEDTLDYIAKTTRGFSVVDLIYFLDEAKKVSKERDKDAIDKTDFTEAYLRVDTGRPALRSIPPESKKLVTAHEASHALTLQIMTEVAEMSNNNLKLPSKINFITLDPRGYYGGAVYTSQNEKNDETNFETEMAEIVCTYGGNSAEDIIFGQNGSWGITGDMNAAENIAETMVRYMGMGPNTGVRRLPEKPDGTLDISEAKRMNMEQDIDSILRSGKTISDMIVREYREFIEEFVENHSDKVGTGDCIISSEDFLKELNEWRVKQSPEDVKAMVQLEKDIAEIVRKTKAGEK